MQSKRATAFPQPYTGRVWEKRIAILALLTGVLLLLGVLARVNWWSLAYVRALTTGSLPTEMPVPPPFHFSGARWQAELALADGRAQAALTLLMGHNDPMSWHTRGKAHSARGEVKEALAAWQMAGDWRSIRELARSLEADERLAQAEEAYRALVTMDRGPGTLEMARFLNRTERRSEGIAWLRSALAENPASAYADQWAELVARWEEQ